MKESQNFLLMRGFMMDIGGFGGLRGNVERYETYINFINVWSQGSKLPGQWRLSLPLINYRICIIIFSIKLSNKFILVAIKTCCEIWEWMPISRSYWFDEVHTSSSLTLFFFEVLTFKKLLFPFTLIFIRKQPSPRWKSPLLQERVWVR